MSFKYFISYRRSDNPDMAGRIFDAIDNYYDSGCVFMDVYSIPSGVDFAQTIHQWITQCDCLVAVIGSNWLNRNKSESGSPESGDCDFVKLEIEIALTQGIDVIRAPRTIHRIDVLSVA